MSKPALALTPPHEAAWRKYLLAHALLLRRLDDDLRSEHGITLISYDALVQLSEAPGRKLRMKDLADALVYSASGLTRLVDALERAGHVTREADPADRRAILVSLTKAGHAALRQAWPTHVAGVNRYFAEHVSEEQADSLATVFGEIVDSLTGKGIS